MSFAPTPTRPRPPGVAQTSSVHSKNASAAASSSQTSLSSKSTRVASIPPASKHGLERTALIPGPTASSSQRPQAALTSKTAASNSLNKPASGRIEAGQSRIPQALEQMPRVGRTTAPASQRQDVNARPSNPTPVAGQSRPSPNPSKRTYASTSRLADGPSRKRPTRSPSSSSSDEPFSETIERLRIAQSTQNARNEQPALKSKLWSPIKITPSGSNMGASISMPNLSLHKRNDDRRANKRQRTENEIQVETIIISSDEDEHLRTRQSSTPKRRPKLLQRPPDRRHTIANPTDVIDISDDEPTDDKSPTQISTPLKPFKLQAQPKTFRQATLDKLPTARQPSPEVICISDDEDDETSLEPTIDTDQTVTLDRLSNQPALRIENLTSDLVQAPTTDDGHRYIYESLSDDEMGYVDPEDDRESRADSNGRDNPTTPVTPAPEGNPSIASATDDEYSALLTQDIQGVEELTIETTSTELHLAKQETLQFSPRDALRRIPHVPSAESVPLPNTGSPIGSYSGPLLKAETSVSVTLDMVSSLNNTSSPSILRASTHPPAVEAFGPITLDTDSPMDQSNEDPPVKGDSAHSKDKSSDTDVPSLENLHNISLPSSSRSSSFGTGSSNVPMKNLTNTLLGPPILLPDRQDRTETAAPSDLPLAYGSVIGAEEFDTSLQDMVNRLPESLQNQSYIREMFCAMIRKNTMLDEPKAPPIDIINPVDYQPSPKFEFYYTNKLYHGAGVPRPLPSKINSCNCKGICNPRRCSCAKKQEGFIRKMATYEQFEGFMYDKAGRLKEFGLPIFECNDECGCSSSCTNRVVGNGRKHRISINKTKNKGWGIFANELIPKGTFVGIYSGELLCQAEAQRRASKYNEAGTTYLFDIDFFYLGEEHKLKRGSANLSPLGNHYSPKRGDMKDELSSDGTKYTVDAYHVGNFTRYLNHSCDPNCCICPVYVNETNIEKPLIVIFTKKDIRPNAELCFSYHGDTNDEETEEAGSDGEDEEDGDESEEEPEKTDAVYAKCYCGAKKCVGKLFT